MSEALLAPFAALIREADIAHLRWALRELHPCHPDVPRIVMRLRRRLDQRNGQSIVRRIYQWL